MIHHASEFLRSNSSVDFIRAYLQDLAAGVTSERLASYFAADALQVEFPNRLNPNGGRSDLPTLLVRAEQGQKVLRSQSYEITPSVENGNQVAVEARWVGVLAVPVGTLQPGAEMRAHFAMFFELENGKIHRQRNYECFEPW